MSVESVPRSDADVGNQEGVGTVRFSGDGKRFMVVTPYGTTSVWAADTLTLVPGMLIDEPNVRARDINHDGTRLVTSSYAEGTSVWKFDRGRAERTSLTDKSEPLCGIQP